jgi:hypothetical protein
MIQQIEILKKQRYKAYTESKPVLKHRINYTLESGIGRAYASAMAKQRPVSGWGACGGGGCGDGRSSRRAMKAPRSGRAGRRSRRAARRTPAMPRPSRTKMLVATPVDAMREGGRGSYALRERGIIRWLGFWSGFGVGFEGRGGLGEGRKTARVKKSREEIFVCCP